ncbi:MAG: histidine triad nucleotide-binding protein [Acidobacteriota bacterium]|jgi:histidine triad (HIT) family protein
MDCLFCSIEKGTIPSKRVHEDERCIAFEDINPQAATHVLVVPRQHLATVNDVSEEHEDLLGHLIVVARKIALERGHGESGYRLVMNCQEGAGQSVFHIHLHLLGGRTFRWPPG